MNPINNISAVLYGIVQGISEFIPISSSGHLALLPHILNIEDPGVLFDLSMHIGTSFAVIIAFREKIISILSLNNKSKNFLINLIISTTTTAIIVFLIKPFISYGRNIKLIAINLIVFAIVMFIADKFFNKEYPNKMKNLQIIKAITIGIFQSFAIFPGVSRSATTICCGLFLKLNIVEATTYSFLLSIPIIIGGSILESSEIINNINVGFPLSSFIIGLITSFITGLLSIYFFIWIIKDKGLIPFCIYRIFLAILILLIF